MIKNIEIIDCVYGLAGTCLLQKKPNKKAPNCGKLHQESCPGYKPIKYLKLDRRKYD